MAAGDPLVDLSEVIALATASSAEQINFFKNPTVAGAAATAPVAGQISSLWKYEGMPGSGASTPSTAAVPTNATAGALKQTSSAASTRKRLVSIMMAAVQVGQAILYDRLSHQGGLSGTSTSGQTTNLPTSALTRRTGGVGVEAWLEIYSTIGTSGTTVTCSYTDDAGNTGNTSDAMTWGGTGYREEARLIALPLASGDKGVRAVASVTAAGSTGTAGNFGVTLAYPLVCMPFPYVGAGFVWNSIQTIGGPLDLGVTSDACLAWAWFAALTGAPAINGIATFLEK